VEGFLAKTSDPNDLLREVDRILSKGRKISRTAGADVKSGKRRILIAEDDPRVSAQMIGFFTSAGYETFWVKDGSNLVEMAVAKQPDVVLLKMAMPRFSGAVAASILATVPEARGIPIVLYDDSGLHRTEAKYANVEHFVPSHSPAELLKAVAAIIGGSSTQG